MTDTRIPLTTLWKLQFTDHRYHRGKMSPHVTNAVLALGLARDAARAGSAQEALLHYKTGLDFWRRANAEEPGRWSEEVALMDEEYTAYLTEYATVDLAPDKN